MLTFLIVTALLTFLVVTDPDGTDANPRDNEHDADDSARGPTCSLQR